MTALLWKDVKRHGGGLFTWPHSIEYLGKTYHIFGGHHDKSALRESFNELTSTGYEVVVIHTFLTYLLYTSPQAPQDYRPPKIEQILGD